MHPLLSFDLDGYKKTGALQGGNSRVKKEIEKSDLKRRSILDWREGYGKGV